MSSTEANIRPLLLDAQGTVQVTAETITARSVTLTARQLCDLELLSNGGFSPLNGFMDRVDYDSVVQHMRLADGTLWPIPVTLEVSSEQAQTLAIGDTVALRDDEGFMLAALDISDIFEPDRTLEASQVYGTTDEAHAGVRQILQQVGTLCLGGTVRAVHLPTHYDFEALRHSPQELRDMFSRLGWRRVVAFHTTRPMHRMQRSICMDAAKRVSSHLLIHPVVGIARPGDVSYYARIKCYRAIERQFPLGIAQLSLLPLAFGLLKGAHARGDLLLPPRLVGRTLRLALGLSSRAPSLALTRLAAPLLSYAQQPPSMARVRGLAASAASAATIAFRVATTQVQRVASSPFECGTKA